MTYHILLRIFKLLQNNPNIGRLSNEAKIKYLKLYKLIKEEINVLIDAEKSIYEKYELKHDESGIIKINDLDESKKKYFISEFNGLHESLSDIVLTKLSETDFFTITENKTINKGENKKIDFCYTTDELNFLFENLCDG